MTPYFFFMPSSFFSIGLSPGAAGAPGVASPPGAGAIAPGPVGAPPGASGAGAAGGGAGGGGAGSSFLPQPPKARVKTKRVTPDHTEIFFPILIHLLSNISGQLNNFYCTSLTELQGGNRAEHRVSAAGSDRAEHRLPHFDHRRGCSRQALSLP